MILSVSVPKVNQPSTYMGKLQKENLKNQINGNSIN
jgi:hypothetical protein